MAIFYSAAHHAFFDDAIHATLPDDAQPISPARHRELLDAQASGATIEAGAKGQPRYRHPSAEARRAALLRQVKGEAARRIARISPSWRQLNDLRAPSPEGADRFAAIDAIRSASDAIEADIARRPSADLAAIDLALHPLWPAE